MVFVRLSSRLLKSGIVVAGLSACSPAKSDFPGVDLGAPSIRWADKNHEQRFGFMAARVQPSMKAAFATYDASYKDDFSCATCHGANPELVDYEMPSPDLYALPKDDPIGQTMEDDEEVGNFMMGVVTPELQKLYDMGHGTSEKATCFSCHPTE